MIKFESIEYKNFLSSGDVPTKIHLSSHKTTLVVGTNGAGKSTMLDALSFALFGKPHRNINKPQLVNSINQKKTEVTVDFSIGTNKYKVVRGIKPNKFEIWRDDKMLNQESHSRDYQKLLENNILKLNHKSFHQIVVLGSSNFIPFMQLRPYDRREVIEDLLDIGIFTKMNAVLKDKITKLRSEITYTQTQIQLQKEKIALQEKHIKELKSIDKNKEKEIQEEIDELQTQVDALVLQNDSLREQLVTEVKEEDLPKCRQKQTQLNKFEGQIISKIERYDNEKKFFTENETCPTCRQTLSDDIKESSVTKIDKELTELNKGYVTLRDEITKADEVYDKTQSELVRIRNIGQDINTNSGKIANAQVRIKTLQSKFGQNNDTSAAEKNLTDLYNNLNAHSKDHAEYNEMLSYSTAVEDLLRDGGIKAKVIKQYLPIINKLINQYLQVLDFFVLFNIDESFNETIRSRHRDDFSYSSFSEGEKSRIDLALMFTWRQIARMKNSTNTNLLVLDETFDSSLDTDGVDNLLKILATLDDNSNTFIISHKTDVLDGKFANKLTFEKVNNFSKLKVS
jgi:DNA repair exonuclease SbcCD ATPase subunit|tara:strand:- start:127 stop:1830 length:1704 start_codon:yes stop_codon:yes gene_type:complete